MSLCRTRSALGRLSKELLDLHNQEVLSILRLNLHVYQIETCIKKKGKMYFVPKIQVRNWQLYFRDPNMKWKYWPNTIHTKKCLWFFLSSSTHIRKSFEFGIKSDGMRKGIQLKKSNHHILLWGQLLQQWNFILQK